MPTATLFYLDHNATTPLLPAVLAAMQPFWSEAFANPASAHGAGRKARQALHAARETVAALLGAAPGEVLFTSGATEANNLAIHGLAGPPPGRILTSPLEHPSVSEPLAQLARQGFALETLAVDPHGIVRLDGLPADARLATLMLANHETGAVQPVADLRQHYAGPIHCDAVQAVGKLPVHFHQLGVTTLSLSAHKFNGPRGVGALLVRQGTTLRPLFHGGHQQQGQRPGTEPVVLAVGLAKALELACAEMAERTAHLHRLRRVFLDHLRAEAAPVILNGPEEGGLPGTVNLSFPGCPADALLMKLDLAGVACSAGSACSSGSLLPSPVLRAMGCPPEVLRSAVRFSLSHLHTAADVDEAARRIVFSVRKLREATGSEDDA